MPALSQHSQASHTTAAYKPASRSKHHVRRRAVIAALIFAALAGIGIATAISLGSDGPQAAAPIAAPNTESASPSAPADSAPLSATPSPSPSPTTEADLSWRDSDFAVNPERTEWNFESDGTRAIYLTFDDGPSQNTERVLDILDRYGIKATFFVTGLMPDYFPWIHEAYARGHTIGMHTYTHDYARVYASTEAYYADLEAISKVVTEQIGYVPAFIRFPGGSSNTISANYTSGIMTALAADVQTRGFQYYDWNASCGDGAVHPADVLIAEATKFADQENIILLMHDSAAKDSTVEALPAIIEFYQERGYEFRALNRDTMVPHHGIGN